MVATGCGYEGNGLFVANVLLLFRIGVRESNKSQENSFLHYMEVTWPIDIVYQPLAYLSLRWITDDEVDHGLKEGTSFLHQKGLNVEEWFAMERLQTLQRCVHGLGVNHVLEVLTERVP